MDIGKVDLSVEWREWCIHINQCVIQVFHQRLVQVGTVDLGQHPTDMRHKEGRADYQFKVMGNRLTNKYNINGSYNNINGSYKKSYTSDFYKVWTLDKEGRLDGQTRSYYSSGQRCSINLGAIP